jgi:hypothetical protein
MKTIKDWLDYFGVKSTEQIKDTDKFKNIVKDLGGASGYFLAKRSDGYELCIISGNQLIFYDVSTDSGDMYPCWACLLIKIDN